MAYNYFYLTDAAAPNEVDMEVVAGAPDSPPFSGWRLIPESDLVPPSGVYKGITRCFREPSNTGDDSGQSVAGQLWLHGWVVAGSLAAYLEDQGRLTWPLPPGVIAFAVHGTPVVSDGLGYFGMPSAPEVQGAASADALLGRGVGLLPFATILDRLKAATTAKRNAMVAAYSQAAFVPAIQRGHAASQVGQVDSAGPYGQDTYTLEQRRFCGRWNLLARVASQALWGHGQPGTIAAWGLFAVLLKAHGFIGWTFTQSDYDTPTAPLREAITMPSGY